MELYKLNTRIFSKPIEYNINNSNNVMVYCFAHHISTIEHMVSGLKQHNIHTVHILKNTKEMSGVENYEVIEQKYKKLGITVIPIPFFEELITTKNESNRVIEYAILNKIDNIISYRNTKKRIRIYEVIDDGDIMKIDSLNNDAYIKY